MQRTCGSERQVLNKGKLSRPVAEETFHAEKGDGSVTRASTSLC